MTTLYALRPSSTYPNAELLTEAELYAFNYCIMLIGGEGSGGHRNFHLGEKFLDTLKVPAADRRIMLQKGMNGLAAKGLIDVKKNGESDYEPTALHLELLIPDSIILQ